MSKRPTGDRHPDASSPQASVTEPPAACPPQVPERLFRLVYTIRAFELRCIKLYRRGP
jgi:TPP-dependent pyruvate/acetoin dehydrogenase alpha subunit